MRRRMAYNTLLQNLPRQLSAPFTTSFTVPPTSPSTASFSSPSETLHTSINPLTSATTSTSNLASNYEYVPLLKRCDYPQARFWDRSSFTNALTGKNATTFGLSSDDLKIEKTDYLEDKNGTPLTEQRRGAIYSHTRRFWNSYSQKSGKFPPTYHVLDLDTLGHFRSEMERHFSELRLCDNHWKADEIWICNYHSWRSSAERQSGMIKTEVYDGSSPMVRKEKPRKRKHNHSPSVLPVLRPLSYLGDAILSCTYIPYYVYLPDHLSVPTRLISDLAAI